MNESEEKQKIRDVIDTWLRASAAGDVDTVLNLMTEDVVFLLPGQPPMRGREVYAARSRAMAGKIRFQGRPDIQEIQLAGDYAFCWNHLSVTITPLPAGPPQNLAGNILSVFRREPDGQWRLFRDANLLTAI
jgi:uncharacterized protein (TIGR02246 family)